MEEDHTVETTMKLLQEGKVRFLGMSGTLPNLPDQVAMGVFDVFPIPYSAVQREHEALIAEAAAAG
jgi:aryl-alcohol dehydrogenase-like predicted oxidoreductase